MYCTCWWWVYNDLRGVTETKPVTNNLYHFIPVMSSDGDGLLHWDTKVLAATPRKYIMDNPGKICLCNNHVIRYLFLTFHFRINSFIQKNILKRVKLHDNQSFMVLESSHFLVICKNNLSQLHVTPVKQTLNLNNAMYSRHSFSDIFQINSSSCLWEYDIPSTSVCYKNIITIRSYNSYTG